MPDVIKFRVSKDWSNPVRVPCNAPTRAASVDDAMSLPFEIRVHVHEIDVPTTVLRGWTKESYDCGIFEAWATAEGDRYIEFTPHYGFSIRSLDDWKPWKRT